MIDNVAVVLSGEAVEPLDEKHVIIQPVDGYRFGADAVSLAKFASGFIKRTDSVFDLCSGCGVVGILVAIATGARVCGAELDGALADMSNRSAAVDGLDAKFFNADIRDLNSDMFSCGRAYDAVLCNPPFFKAHSRARKIAPTANSELTVTFEQVVAAAKKLLKPLGTFCLVYTAARLDEAVCVCRENGLTPKELIINGNGKTFLMRCVLGGKDGLTVRVGNV